MLRGGRINEQATILTEAVHRASEPSTGAVGEQNNSEIRASEEKALEEYAKNNGAWIEDKFGCDLLSKCIFDLLINNTNLEKQQDPAVVICFQNVSLIY